MNCVAPGVIETDMMAAFTAEDKAALAEETPVGRLGTADEVAKLLVFLAGEDAGYITRQVFGVNRGSCDLMCRNNNQNFPRSKKERAKWA